MANIYGAALLMMIRALNRALRRPSPVSDVLEVIAGASFGRFLKGMV
jgi:hypothetical protein